MVSLSNHEGVAPTHSRAKLMVSLSNHAGLAQGSNGPPQT